ncbi:hypothetical protein GA0111570_11158 [Raineyella antarctica]|uniref:PrgI family protein n=1 Tax=Raineyella antarctica TaxID=1577474 RepID=A0A1G6HM43_9ACTN|nr:SCO6880 family protein [Raineyella antarctica]SDB94955.1 hypothetical protein GA0111570_11158 [Raineyella antarctica]
MSESTTYGNWTRPQIKGIAGVSMAATALLALGAVAMIIAAMTQGFLGAVVVFFATGALMLPLLAKSPATGMTLYEKFFVRAAKARMAHTGSAVLLQGPCGMTRDGQARLPGLLAASELIEATDAYGTPFGIVHVPSTDHYSVVIEGASTGMDLVDADKIDRQVAIWGQWLAMLGQEQTDIAGAQVSIETAPDPGVRLRHMIEARRATHGPSAAFADQVMGEIKAAYPAGQAQMTTRISVTFRSRTAPGGPKRPTEEMIRRIGNALPSMLVMLRESGAGQQPTPMTGQDLVDAVRVAYDPSVATDVEEARAAGGTGLTWQQAGPTFADDRRPDVYRHDRAWSMSWEMLQAPRSIVHSDVLARLLAPHPEIPRKRVTLVYRPLTMETSARVVEGEVQNALFVLNNNKQATSRDSLRLRHAQQTANEEATGAGMIRFGVIITATVLDPTDLSKIIETIRQLSAASRLKLRPATWTQAATFAAGLPLGLVLPEHTAIPAEWKDAL